MTKWDDRRCVNRARSIAPAPMFLTNQPCHALASVDWPGYAQQSNGLPRKLDLDMHLPVVRSHPLGELISSNCPAACSLEYCSGVGCGGDPICFQAVKALLWSASMRYC